MADEFMTRCSSSTVFACDLSSDTRYIRCDFPQCSEHGQAVQAKPSWMLNTLKNVRILEKHVGKEIHNYMKSQPLRCVFSESRHKTESKEFIERNQLPVGTKKVLAVFNLKDSQSQLGEWLAHFLDAAFISEYGDKRKDFVVLTQDFVSRYELMKSISNLEFLKSCSPKVEVTCVLSCHSSSQGQVFSCTPSDISKEHGFEEFCSLHDMTVDCQDALGDTLSGIHISSCFTLKLDCSHEEWPVDSSWFKNKLKCRLTGSVREVYETGSQVCDLHILLTAILSPPIAPLLVGSCGERLQKAICNAQTESFPDLALEMGLEILDDKAVDTKLLTPGTDDKVSPPILVNSEVFVALLVEQETNSPEKPSQSVVLSEAIITNLSIRQASDIRCSYMVLPITIDRVSSIRTKSSVKAKLSDLPVSTCKVLFVVLSPSLANPSTGLVEAVRTWSSNRGGNKIYGIHFQEISALQAYYIKNRLQEEVALIKYNKNCEEESSHLLEHIAITGLVDNSDKNPHMAYPVLLYLIHLAIGENGPRQARKGLPSGVYTKKPMGPGTSCWTLEEVYMETCHVLSGLARKCSLQVLSLQNNTSLNTSVVTMEAKVAVSIPFCSTSDDKVVTLHERPSTSSRTDTSRSTLNSTDATSNTCTRAMPGRSGVVISNYEVSTNPPGHCSSVGNTVPVVSRTKMRDSKLSRKRSFDMQDDVEVAPDAKKLPSNVLQEMCEPCSSSDIVDQTRYLSPVKKCKAETMDIDSCTINMSTTNKCSGVSKVPSLKANSLKVSSPNKFPPVLNSAKGTQSHGQDDRELIMIGTRTDSSVDVIVVDDDSDDEISVIKTDSKATQANIAPLSPRKKVKRSNTQQNTPSSLEHDKSTQKKLDGGKSQQEGYLHEGPHSSERTSDSQTQQNRCSLSCKIESSVDIPLLANVDEVLVTHYVLDLTVDFDQQIMSGSIVLFIDPANQEATNKSFHLCLDSTLVNIQSVSEVFLPDDFKIPFFGRTSQTDQPRSDLTKDGTGSVKTEVEILDDDVPSPDQSDVSDMKSSDRKNESGLSLFQRLQKNYGVGIHDNKSTIVPLSCQDGSNVDSSTESPEANSPMMQKETSPTAIDGSGNTCSLSTLPEFLDLLSGKSSSQQPLSFKGLKYSVYGWCVKVHKEGATGKAWPRCVCIKYHTSPEGQSLTWTKDQDGRPCVFSPGAYINNRSLMPCQEPPVAMSTWHAAIRVPKGCMVYMSGCPIPVVNSDIMSDKVTHYYEMDSALPCSTLALAVGWLAYREGSPAMVPTTQGSQRPIPCRIIAVPSLIDVASTQLLEHSSRYLVEACKLLGPYPFDRLDLLILPRCFACMGLKSPNLAFLSQSILSSDSSLRLRVAHEVTHAWFGLLIGAKDWTEEWLSEGFATYLEDTVQSRAEKWPVLQDQQYREIRQVLRYRTLSAEMQVTDKDMQCLRPKKTKQNLIERAEETNVPPDEEQPAPSTIIKYKCSKKWTQVHYLKGYFLLIHMENMVGRQNFEKFLHDYVQHYQGRLVTSEDFFEFFLRSFTMFDDAVQDGFIHEWLECSGLPKSLRRKNFAGKDNVLVNQALHEFEFWRRQDTTNKRNKAKKAKSRKEPENFTLQTSEQIVLMLEKLLQRDDILHTTLRQLNKVYQFATRNAEIRHRWCELVVKHKYTTELKDVRQFLIEDQGMGIYLFGELIISGQGKQRALAEEIFEEIGPEMDRCTFKTVSDMLAGVD